MSDWMTERPTRHDVVAVPVVWITAVLSLLIHVGALFIAFNRMHPISPDEGDKDAANSSLAVQLTPRRAPDATPPPAPPPSSAPSIALAPQATPARRPARRALTTPAPSRPPVIAQTSPRPDVALPVTPPAPPVPPAPPTPPARTEPAPPVETDLAAYVEARRRARGETSSAPGVTPNAPPAEDDFERRKRLVASNLGVNRTPTFGQDERNAGGIFQIVRVEYDAADFYFFGLNRDINRNAKQLIEVRRGSASDIRVAVVRKMIAIIRDQVSGDFTWQSRRGTVVKLSARPADNAELEAFIYRDIFPDQRAPQ